MLRAAHVSAAQQCTTFFPSHVDLLGTAPGSPIGAAPMMPISPSSSLKLPLMHSARGFKQPGGVFPLPIASQGLHAALHWSMTQGFASSASPGGIEKDGEGKGGMGSGSGAGEATTAVSSEGDPEPLRMSLQEAIMRLAEAAVGKVS